MTTPNAPSKPTQFLRNNWPVFLLLIVCLLPATKLGISYILGLSIIGVLGYSVFLILQVAGMSVKSPGNFTLSVSVSVVTLAFLALFNVAFLALPIAGAFILVTILISRWRATPGLRWIPEIFGEQQGLKFGFIATSVLGIWAWFQISSTIFSGNRLDVNKLFSDVPLLAGLTRSLADGAGLEAPFLDGFELRYHWLSYGFSAWISDTTGIDPIVSTFGIVPFLAFLLSLVLAGALASNISKSKWAPSLAISALALVGWVGVWRYAQSSVWEWGSPSTLLGGVFGLAVTLVIFKSGFRNVYIQTLLAFLLALGATLSKVSMGVVLGLTAVGAIAFLVLGFRFKFQTLILPILAIPVGTAIALLATFSGAGGSISINPIWGQLFDNGAIQFIEIAGSELSFLAANVFLWSGIILVITTQARTELAYVWAAVAGVAGQFMLLLLSAPAANERFFAIAGMTIAIPVLATLLLRIRISHSALTVSRFFTLTVFILLSSVIVAIAAWNETLDQRPTLMLGILLSLSLIFALLTWRMVEGVRGFVAFVMTAALFFIPLSITTPQILKFLDEKQISTSGGLLLAQLVTPEFENAMVGEWRRGFAELNVELSPSQPIAIWRSESIPEVIGRWAIYDLESPIFVSTGVGAEELTSSQGQLIGDRRRSLVDEALAGSRDARIELCNNDVEKIIILGKAEDEWTAESSQGSNEIGIHDLACSRG